MHQVHGFGVSNAAWEQHRLGEAASLSILEKQGPFDHRCTERKNLTHLQSILLFTDSGWLNLSMLLAHCPSCANYMGLLGDPSALRKGSHPTGRLY